MLVAIFVTVTVAPGTAACCSSSTVPSRRPVCSCAASGALANEQNATSRATPRGLISIGRPPRSSTLGSHRPHVNRAFVTPYILLAPAPIAAAETGRRSRPEDARRIGAFNQPLHPVKRAVDGHPSPD